MLPIIKNRIDELEKEFNEIQKERLVMKYAALNSKSYVQWIDDHRAEIDALQEKEIEKDNILNMLEVPVLNTDDKDVVRGYLKWQFDFIRELDKISKNPALVKSRAARINEITRLLEAIEEEE